MTGTLTVVGPETAPGTVIILGGTDRRRTDVVGGSTTDASAMSNTRLRGPSVLPTDERDFRLVRVDRTYRVPVAASTAAAVATASSGHEVTWLCRWYTIQKSYIFILTYDKVLHNIY